MKRTIIIVLLLACISTFGQKKDTFTYPSSGSQLSSLKDINTSQYNTGSTKKPGDVSSTNIKDKVLVKTKKSPGLAFLISLAVPGLGQTYAGRFDVGKYFMISEASLWMTYAAFTIYGNWLLNDAYDFAVIHAGIDRNGKNDQFYLDIANWDNVNEYNNSMLQQGDYNKLYYPDQGWGFFWDQVSNRKLYREDKLAADRMKNDRLFIIGAVLVNHVISAISAIFVTNSYNESLNTSGGYALNADVMKYGSRPDGIKLKLTKWF